MASKFQVETYSMFPDDVSKLSDVSKRLGMNKSEVVRLAISVIYGHVKSVQNEVSQGLKPGQDFQSTFQHRILNDFDFLVSGRVKIKKSKKTLEELKKEQVSLF